MHDIAGKLHKEIQDVAKPYLDQLQELEALARNKRQAVTCAVAIKIRTKSGPDGNTIKPRRFHL